MNELQDFIHFKEHQLDNVNFETGVINTKFLGNNQYGKRYTITRKNVGSKNEDGYIRLWCGKRLRMKHRLLYYLYHNELPIEIDHINGIRDDNSISNLRSVTRKEQLQNIQNTTSKRKKFTKEELHSICHLISEKIPDLTIAKQFNCSRTAIMGIRQKRRHSNIADKYF